MIQRELTVERSLGQPRLIGRKPLEQVRKVQNLIPLVRGKAFMHRLRPLHQSPDLSYPLLLHSQLTHIIVLLHLHISIRVIASFFLHIQVDLILPVIAFARTNRTICPVVAVDLRGSQGGDAGDA